MHWSLQDCTLQGGNILLAPPHYLWPAGSVSWNNNLFDRVGITLIPTMWPDALEIDLPFRAYNNLLRGGWFDCFGNGTSAGNWVVKDNLFDGVYVVNPVPGYEWVLALDHDYNAYWQSDPLVPNASDGSIDGANDINSAGDRRMNAAPLYQIGPLG